MGRADDRARAVSRDRIPASDGRARRRRQSGGGAPRLRAVPAAAGGRARRLPVARDRVDLPWPARSACCPRGGGAAARGATACRAALPVVPEAEPDGHRHASLRPDRPADARAAGSGCSWPGAVVLAASAATVLAVTGDTSQAPGGNEVAAIGASTGQHLSYTGVGTTPGNVVFGDGGVWVLNADDRTITHIDPATRRVVKTFATTGEPTDLAAGDGALWVGSAVGRERADRKRRGRPWPCHESIRRPPRSRTRLAFPGRRRPARPHRPSA